MKVIHPPISNLEDVSETIRGYRVELDRGENNKYAQSELTDLAEQLLDHCDFLSEKLGIKVSRSSTPYMGNF